MSTCETQKHCMPFYQRDFRPCCGGTYIVCLDGRITHVVLLEDRTDYPHTHTARTSEIHFVLWDLDNRGIVDLQLPQMELKMRRGDPMCSFSRYLYLKAITSRKRKSL